MIRISQSISRWQQGLQSRSPYGEGHQLSAVANMESRDHGRKRYMLTEPRADVPTSPSFPYLELTPGRKKVRGFIPITGKAYSNWVCGITGPVPPVKKHQDKHFGHKVCLLLSWSHKRDNRKTLSPRLIPWPSPGQRNSECYHAPRTT